MDVRFTATRNSKDLNSMLTGLTVIICFEAIAIGLPVAFFLLHGVWRWVFIGGFLALDAYALTGFSALRNAHYVVTERLLSIRLGARLRLDIPLERIIRAEIIGSSQLEARPVATLRVKRIGRTVYALSRDSDIVKIVLEPGTILSGKGWPTAPDLRELVTNVDEPEAFIQAFSAGPVRTTREEVPASPAALKSSPQPINARQPSTEPVLELKGVSKRYGSVRAVEDLSMVVRPGDVVGLLGANGAGKTTTIEMIVGLVRPDSGTIRIKDVNTWEHPEQRGRVGYVADVPLFYERLSGYEFLDFVAGLYEIPDRRNAELRVSRWLSRVGLTADAHRPISGYSLGMKRRLALAGALLPDPEVIIIDELTQAFDAPAISELRRLLRDLSGQGKAVLVTTHIMDQAERLCSRLVILDNGRQVMEGTVDDVLHRAGMEGGSLEEAFLALTRVKGAGAS